MRKRITYRPYLFFAFFLFCVVNIPTFLSEKFRLLTIRSLSFPWESFHHLKEKTHQSTLATTQISWEKDQAKIELDQLKQENQLLQAQISSVREWLFFKDHLEKQKELLAQIRHILKKEETGDQEFFVRRAQELCTRLEMGLQSVPAKVIFREPLSWSSSIWINVGEKTNGLIGKKIVAKHSPVLAGTSIVGIIEEVGEKHSRVRLITDAGLVPSVRAIRGGEQNRFLLEHLNMLLINIESRPDIFPNIEKNQVLTQWLLEIKQKIDEQHAEHYLAKGELYGCSHPLWRSRNQILRGVGFNYDYADEDGPARDLHTGESLDPLNKKRAIPLLQSGDLLVTTGMDGIFPKGFRVGVVTRVFPLAEGASTYEIEARATAGNLDNLNEVVILPPVQEEKL